MDSKQEFLSGVVGSFRVIIEDETRRMDRRGY